MNNKEAATKIARDNIIDAGLTLDRNSFGVMNIAVEAGYEARAAENAQRLVDAERMIDAAVNDIANLGIKAKQFFGEYRAKYPETAERPDGGGENDAV